MDQISKESLYREVDSFQNVETILDILASGTTALESTEAAKAHGAKDDIIKQYIMSVDAYSADIAEEQLELENGFEQPRIRQAVNGFKKAIQYGISFFSDKHPDDLEEIDYDELRYEHFQVSVVDSLIDRLEALSDVYETLKIIAYLDSQGQSDTELSKTLIIAEQNNTMSLLKRRIGAEIATLKKIVDAPFHRDVREREIEINFDKDEERVWTVLALANHALNLDIENIENAPSPQEIKFSLPEQIKTALYHTHSELTLTAGKYFYDLEYSSDLDTAHILSPEAFKSKRAKLSETAKTLYPLCDSILQNGIRETTKYTHQGLSSIALKCH